VLAEQKTHADNAALVGRVGPGVSRFTLGTNNESRKPFGKCILEDLRFYTMGRRKLPVESLAST